MLATPAPYWPAVSVDATLVDRDKAPRDIAGLPLWPSNRPEQILSLWQEMRQALCQANEGWEVWTDWYEDRLEGRIRSEAHELHYSGIDRPMWNEGPQVVNAEIKRQIEADEANLSENGKLQSHHQARIFLRQNRASTVSVSTLKNFSGASGTGGRLRDDRFPYRQICPCLSAFSGVGVFLLRHVFLPSHGQLTALGADS